MIVPVHDACWTAFVDSCPDALPFHHPAWAALLAECYGYHPFVLALTDTSGAIVAGLPVLDVSRVLTGRRWAALPFTDYCPLLTRNVPPAQLVDALVAEVRAQRVDAFEQHADLPARAHVHTHTDAVRHTLALCDDPATVYGRFSKTHQRNIRKAERAGVQMRQAHSLAAVDTFYDLHLLTRRRLGVPIQPRRFFHLLAHRITARQLGFVLSAYVDQVPVASAVFMGWNGTLIYKYGASDPKFWHYRPNNLLFWTAIRWACENGYHTLDWGRSDLEDHGLRAFKSGWGAHEEPLVYSVIGDSPPKRSLSHMKNAMSMIIRHSPPWVCQFLGERLYRYAT